MTGALSEISFPDETQEYRRARNNLLEAEIELRRQIETVAAQRPALPFGGKVRTDYVFEVSPPGEKGFKAIRLSELFEPDKDSLFLYSFMFPENAGPTMTPCPSCTSIIDGIDGAAPHIMQRVHLAVCAKAPIAMFREHADNRGWRNVLLLSSAGNTYNHDYHAEGAGRTSESGSDCVHSARRPDSPLLEHRALVRSARARAGHAARRFHVADVEHLRLHRGREGFRLGTPPHVLTGAECR